MSMSPVANRHYVFRHLNSKSSKHQQLLLPSSSLRAPQHSPHLAERSCHLNGKATRSNPRDPREVSPSHRSDASEYSVGRQASPRNPQNSSSDCLQTNCPFSLVTSATGATGATSVTGAVMRGQTPRIRCEYPIRTSSQQQKKCSKNATQLFWNSWPAQDQGDDAERHQIMFSWHAAQQTDHNKGRARVRRCLGPKQLHLSVSGVCRFFCLPFRSP